MKAEYYAHALYDLSKDADAAATEEYLSNMKALLKKRGHESLYPSIVRVFVSLSARETDVAASVSVAKKDDIARYKEEILETARAMGLSGVTLNQKVDETLVGGFRVESEDQVVDKSYKRSLIELYRQLVA